MSILSLVRSRFFIAALVLGVALALAAACGDDGDGDQTPADGETPAAGGATAEIKMLPGTTFDTGELTIAADTDVTVTADNTNGTHNFAVYESEDDALAGGDQIGQTEICTAPCVDTVTLTLAAGEYFFRCEVHPGQMTGTLIAQ